MKYYLKWQLILASPKLQPFGSKELTKGNEHQNALVAQGTMFSLTTSKSFPETHKLVSQETFFPFTHCIFSYIELLTEVQLTA